MYTPDELVKVAVHEIVSGINTGLTPQDATTKVAKDLKLNQNFIKRASEAVNVALHHDHFKKNAEAKADDFATVDAQKVVEDIYGKKEKTASQYRSDLFSSFQLPDEITPKFARYLEDGPHKEAYAKIMAIDEITKFATSEKGVYEKSINYINNLKKIAFEKEAEAIEAEFQIEKSFCDILRKFASDSAYRSSWDTFETAVYSKHGENSSGYLNLLYKAAKLNEERGKHDSNIKLASDCAELAMYDTFVDNIAKFNVAKQASDDAQYNFNFEQDYISQAFKARGCELNKSSEAVDDSSILEKVERAMMSERTKVASTDLDDPVLAQINEKKAKELDIVEENIKSAIALLDFSGDLAKSEGKPNLSASTNTPEANRSRALLLQELVTSDPIISKFPTHQTVNAYNQLLRIAPELSSEKEVTRAFLRQAGASQAIDPFQAEQLIKANTQLFKQHQLQKGLQPAPESKG